MDYIDEFYLRSGVILKPNRCPKHGASLTVKLFMVTEVKSIFEQWWFNYKCSAFHISDVPNQLFPLWSTSTKEMIICKTLINLVSFSLRLKSDISLLIEIQTLRVNYIESKNAWKVDCKLWQKLAQLRSPYTCTISVEKMIWFVELYLREFAITVK